MTMSIEIDPMMKNMIFSMMELQTYSIIETEAKTRGVSKPDFGKFLKWHIKIGVEKSIQIFEFEKHKSSSVLTKESEDKFSSFVHIDINDLRKENSTVFVTLDMQKKIIFIQKNLINGTKENIEL